MGKKILIITYFKSVNPGTFLQAYSVQKGMKLIYPDSEITFLRTDHKRKLDITVSQKMSLYDVLLSKMYSLVRRIIYRTLEKNTFKNSDILFNCFDYNEDEFVDYVNNYDMLIVGSDTILEQVAQQNQIGIMWGNERIKIPQIMFAVSADDCIENFNSVVFFGSLEKKLLVFKQIGVRDDIVKSFFIEKLNLPEHFILKQPDPTYLLPLHQFKLKNNQISKLKKLKGKIAIFNFNRRFIYRKDLATVLKRLGYKLVSIEYDPDCDLSFKNLQPFEWAALFHYCEVVFTERFHDTVFSLRNNKPVFSIDWQRKKINENGSSKRSEILKEYGLSAHHITIFNQESINMIPDKVADLVKNFDVEHNQMINDRLIKRAENILNRINYDLKME